MTDATQIAQIPPPLRSNAFTLSPEVSALSVEIAKCLKLVAPASMAADAQLSWIASAVDALEGIRAAEVSAISAELRRSVTRPAQIVPEIARLVADKRKRSASAAEPESYRAAAELRIDREARERYSRTKTQEDIEEVWWWERNERTAAGLSVRPLPKPLTRDELETLPADIIAFGLSRGFLERRNGQLIETNRYSRT